MQAAAALVALALGIANLVWLVVQWRRGAETLRIAREAHGWARERRDAERAASDRQEAKRARFAEVKRQLEASTLAYMKIPDDLTPELVIEGEQLGYFRRVSGTLEDPGPFLARAIP